MQQKTVMICVGNYPVQNCTGGHRRTVAQRIYPQTCAFGNCITFENVGWKSRSAGGLGNGQGGSSGHPAHRQPGWQNFPAGRPTGRSKKSDRSIRRTWWPKWLHYKMQNRCKSKPCGRRCCGNREKLREGFSALPFPIRRVPIKMVHFILRPVCIRTVSCANLCFWQLFGSGIAFERVSR